MYAYDDNDSTTRTASKGINKSTASDLFSLAQTLACKAEDLLE